MPLSLPKVSILISAYNKEQTVLQALESALAQSYPNKEVVIAEDQSQDKTWSLLQRYQNLAGIRILQNQKNLGRVANHRHLLSDLGQGDFAVMLDADDYFLDADFISQAVDMAILNGIDFVFAESKLMDLKGKVRPVGFPFGTGGLISYQDIFKRGILFMHGAVLYQREKALQLDFYSKDIIADDNESFLRFIVGKKVGFLKQSAYLYRQNNSPDRFTLDDRLSNDKMIDSVYDFAIKTNPEEKELFKNWQIKMRANFFYGNLINLLAHRKLGGAVEYLRLYYRKKGPVAFFRALVHLLVALKWAYLSN